jgi:hypothetical protein
MVSITAASMTSAGGPSLHRLPLPRNAPRQIRMFAGWRHRA